MSIISGIPHPFLNDAGTSQQDRLQDKLDPAKLEIDDRKMVDILDFLSQFARQVNYYNHQLEKRDWRKFFSNSLPVLVANIHRFDVAMLEDDFQNLIKIVERQPKAANLQQLFDFIYLEELLPLNTWQKSFERQQSALGQEVDSLITANLQEPLKHFVGLFNAANYWYCLQKRSFSEFEGDPWGLDFTDLFAQNNSFRKSGGGPTGRILALKKELEELFGQFLVVIKNLSQIADEYIDQALIPLKEEYQEKHPPHLGLLFTFMKLFEFLQKDLNQLTGKHLDYFYQNVLGIQPRKVIPDSAHLVVEIQDSLENYLLKAGTVFQDGKDANGNDLFYTLDEEIILDKAQIASKKTLFVHRQKEAVCSDCIMEDHFAENPDEEMEETTQADTPPDATDDPCVICNFIKGVYKAPIADSADGKGEAFADPATASWATLGSKYSKFYPEEPVLPDTLPLEHPPARIGFVVASPVLLLKEGKRTVTFRIEGDYQPTDDCKLDLLNLDFEAVGSDKDKYQWSVLENCLTKEDLGLDIAGEGWVRRKLMRSGSICWTDATWIEFFEENNFDFSDKLLIQETLSEETPAEVIVISGDKIPATGLSQEINDYLTELLGSREALEFENDNEFEAFLEPFKASGEDAEIRDLSQKVTVTCLTSESFDRIKDKLSVNARSALSTIYDSLEEQLCFPKREYMEAFLMAKDQSGRLIINDFGVQQIIDKAIITRDSDGNIIKYCLIPESLDRFSATGRELILKELGAFNSWFCLDSMQELDVFLDRVDSNGNKFFTSVDKVRIKQYLTLNGNIPCITPETMLKATYLSQRAWNALYEELQRRSRLCFLTKNELMEFLGTLESEGNPAFDLIDLHVFEDRDFSTSAIYETTAPLFKIQFSGEEEWIPSETFVTRFIPKQEGGTKKVAIEIEGTISDDQPAVTFANKEVLLEDFRTHLPLAKIELNEQEFVVCKGAVCPPKCDLDRCTPYNEEVEISLYHFLKDYKVEDFCIDVKVCGLRNFVVQNDEALQDVNAPIFPYGTRPTIDSNFYIGSKEIFYKNWKKLWVNINWKDKPEDFEKYYLGYGTVTSDGRLEMMRDEDFKMTASVLQEFSWKEEQEEITENAVTLTNPYTIDECAPANVDPEVDHRPLFDTSDPLNPLCEPFNPFEQRIELDSEFFNWEPVRQTMEVEPLTQYLSETQNGFMRLTLKCQDFQHREYPFVLARQMLAFGKFPEEFVYGAIYVYDDEIIVDEEGFIQNLERKGLNLFEFFLQVERATEFAVGADDGAEPLVGEVKNAIDPSLLNQLKANLKTAVNDLITSEFDRVKNNNGPDTLNQLILDLDPLIETFVAEPAIANSVGTVLDDFATNVINGITASDVLLDQYSTQILELLTTLLSNPGADHQAQLDVLRDAIAARINSLLETDPSDADIVSLSEAMVEEINSNVLSGLDESGRLGLADSLIPILENPEEVNQDAIANSAVTELDNETGNVLTDDQKTTLNDRIINLLNDPQGLSISEQAAAIVFNMLNPLLGGLDENQYETILNQINDQLTNFNPSEAGVTNLANAIIELFVIEFTPASTGSDPNLGNALKEDIEQSLNDFLADVKANASVNPAARTTAITAIVGIVENSIKGFVDSDPFKTAVQDLLEKLSQVLQDSINDPVIDDVFSAMDLDIIGLSKITEEVELAALGSYSDISTDCSIDDARLDQIIGSEAAGDVEAYLKVFDISPADNKEDLKSLISSYCYFLTFGDNGDDQDENIIARESLETALKTAQDNYRSALSGGDEQEIENKKTLLDVAIASWNEFAEPFVAFVEGLDNLEDSEITAEPVKLRALLPYLGLDNLAYGASVFLRYKNYLNDRVRKGTVAIPNEPYTPEIKEIALDYTACACKGEKDFKFIHLYPFEKTNKDMGFTESGGGALPEEPVHLFPYHSDSGTLFLGFENLRPGSNVQLFFQLAEATGNTELLRPDLKWAYLHRENRWEELKAEREIIYDDTLELATSGIVKINIPTFIAKPQAEDQELPEEEIPITIMPPEYRWLKVSVPENAEAFSETAGIFTQAVKVAYQAEEINVRNSMDLEAEQIAALAVADSNIKGITQPFTSFGGRLPEEGNNFNKRVSEYLRHKGRAITPFDYESMVLDTFPTIFRAKCIAHSLGLPATNYSKDLDLAPGFINVAVIPDLEKVKSGNPLEPRASISLLTEIEEYLRTKNTAFARLRAMNPRYEKVNIEVEVGFRKGKDATYYSEKLQEDIIRFLAPWLNGEYHKLNFGLNVSRSRLMQFIENRDYIDFVSKLGMVHQDDVCQVKEEQTGDDTCAKAIDCPEGYHFCQTKPPDCKVETIFPMTARSILTAGKIEVMNYAEQEKTVSQNDQ